jgi:hypothetical protein
MQFASLALVTPLARNKKIIKIMKKLKKSEDATLQIDPDEILPEYDFSKARPNKYARRNEKGALVVTVDPEVARVFPTAQDVNQTLRLVARGVDAAVRAEQLTHSTPAPARPTRSATKPRRVTAARKKRGARSS